MPVLMAISEGFYLRTKDPVYLDLRHSAKIKSTFTSDSLTIRHGDQYHPEDPANLAANSHST
jgi:hypothetical protein